MKNNFGRSFVYFFVMVITFFFMESCTTAKKETALERGTDVHSFANTNEVEVTHLHMDLEVDFVKKQLIGKASLQIKNKTGAQKLYLDTRDLTIERVTLGESEVETNYSLGSAVKYLGQPLMIDLEPDVKVVNIYYNTSPQAAALQWLTPEQTAGGKYPFLFTQSQAVLARSWVPCQDTPGIRMTYSARIKTDPSLMVVMSAKNSVEKSADGIYSFEMNQAIPSYLLAMAVGELEYRALGPHSGVYAEPDVVAKAAFEFADTEKMIQSAEMLYGPYRWEKYDLLVLPPSFPFGGMENPRITFVTPTLLAGDRSLVSLVAHELAHSWSGNLVTNATWNDFWLNEGFTVYFESRIMEAVYGKDYEQMLAQLGHQGLVETVSDLEKKSPDDTHLFLNLKDRDPDEGMTDIAYEKGRYFLLTIENTVGRETWDAFLKEYFSTFSFKSMSTEKFVQYLREHLIKGDKVLEDKIMIDRWIYGPGLPDNCPVPNSKEFQKVETQLAAWKDGKPAQELQTNDWTTHHRLHFLQKLPQTLSQRQLADLDSAFNFTRSGNSEISCAWFLNTVRNKYEPADTALEKFLIGVGRRKFLKPLYEELAKTEEGKKKALRIYQAARSGYHSISYLTIDNILGYKPEMN